MNQLPFMGTRNSQTHVLVGRQIPGLNLMNILRSSLVCKPEHHTLHPSHISPVPTAPHDQDSDHDDSEDDEGKELSLDQNGWPLIPEFTNQSLPARKEIIRKYVMLCYRKL
jgi:hypothetical protein